ncbi:hypothetical protein AB0M29_43835 [Streptomyces sp. NPDC051976]|uniref:hypothetical protein n=1 Tax=Streptomyces sp. NPDC051976 TaxID=3154947 RepID=UPI0034379452
MAIRVGEGDGDDRVEVEQGDLADPSAGLDEQADDDWTCGPTPAWPPSTRRADGPLQGLSDKHGEALVALPTTTVGDLSRNKYIRWADPLADLVLGRI